MHSAFSVSPVSSSDMNKNEIVCDSEEGEDDERMEQVALVRDEEYGNIVWTGPGRRLPVLLFSPDAVSRRDFGARIVGEKYHLSYKVSKTECKLVKAILHGHGFHEAHPNSSDYNLEWTGAHLKPYVLRSMTEFQKINHFPRSYELTRKDRLFKNVQRMQQLKGQKNFDFVPMSYVLPGEFQDFCQGYLKDKGPYIVKPVASSRGRGIFLATHPDQIPLDEQLVVCKYLHNPFLIDSFKFDLRIYVAVTSYDPLIVYLYEEGMARFATEKYNLGAKFMSNSFMHLTNYSINKNSADFVQNDDPDVEDYGNKWTLGALLRYLRSQGHDTAALMMRLEDVVIKAILSIEMQVATACKMFEPYRGNCFELYGFDIILDEDLRPWLLEVNLSPSLACDAPIDFKIKCHMLSDLFSLVGVACHDPTNRTLHHNVRQSSAGVGRLFATGSMSNGGSRPGSANGRSSRHARSQSANHLSMASSNVQQPNAEETRILRRAREEYSRRGGWLRIMPTKNSWYLYGSFFQTPSSFNLVLHQQLFPKVWQNVNASGATNLAARNKVPIHSLTSASLAMIIDGSADHHKRLRQLYKECCRSRIRFYERKLGAELSQPFKSDQRNSLLPPRGATNSKRRGARSGPLAKGIFRGHLQPAQTFDSDVDSDAGAPVTPSLNSDARVEALPLSRSNSHEHFPPSASSPPLAASTLLSDSNVSSEREHPLPTTQTIEQSPRDYNAAEVIGCGAEMNKVQARHAFAAYLSRLQTRMLSDANYETGHDDDDDDEKAVSTANEQIDLVLRFLRRATANLEQDFKVSAPSRKLPLRQRQQLLAKVLGDFIHVYSKETERNKNKEKESAWGTPTQTTSASQKHLSEYDFYTFLRYATEAEIEQLLSVYTKVNKSAGIFMSEKSAGAKCSSSSSTCSAPISLNMSSTMKPVCKPPSGSSSTSLASTASSYARAVHVYSQRLKSSRQRPSSATISADTNRPSSSLKDSAAATVASRSNSVTVLRSRAAMEPAVQAFDESGINEALQKLALRQQARQYAAYRVNSALTRQDKHRSSSLVDMYCPSKQEPHRRIDLQLSSVTSAVSNSSAAAATTATSSPSAADIRLKSAQSMLMQQIQQSRVLLESSKAKHDALLLQAQGWQAKLHPT